MITKKLWNTLTQETRNDIVKTLGYESSYVAKYAQTYYHDFDFDQIGRHLKRTLEACNLQKDGTIKVCVTIKPKYETKAQIEARKSAATSKSKQLSVNEATAALLSGFNSAVTYMPQIIKQFGRDGFISVDTEMGWNYKIDGFSLNRKGEVLVTIYWQGDDTDGNDCVSLAKVHQRGDDVIPADSYWDGNRTRYNHSDIRVTKSSVYDAIKKLAESLHN